MIQIAELRKCGIAEVKTGGARMMATAR